MTIVGTAEIAILANDTGFDRSLESMTAAPLGDLERDADQAGQDAGAALSGGMSKGVKDGGDDVASALSGSLGTAGAKAGDDLEKGVKGGLEKTAEDAEKAGTDSGAKFSKGMSGGLGALSKLLGAVGLNLGPLQQGLDKSSSALGHTNQASGDLESGLVSLGRTTTIVGGVGLLGAAAASLKLGTDFQKTTATMAANGNLQANTAKQISDAFLAGGHNVIYTAQQEEAAFGDVAARLTQIPGYTQNAANATKFMGVAMDLAEESGQQLGSTTTTLAGIMQAFQVPVKDAAATADDLENASRLTGQSVDGLANTMERLKARMGVAAPSIADFSTLLVDLQDHGVAGSRGLMVLNSATNTLLKPSDALTKAQIAQKQAFDALPPSLQKLAAAYEQGGMTSAQLSAALKGTAGATTASTNAFTTQIAALKDQKAQLAVQAAAITGNTAADKAQKQAIKEQTAEINAQITTLQGQASAMKSSSSAKGAAAKASAGLTLGEQQLWKTFTSASSAVDKNSTAVSNLGLHLYNAQGQFVGMGSVIAQLQPKIKDMTQAQQLATLSQVFGANASKALLDTVLAGPAAYNKAQKAITDQAAAHHALVVQQQTLGHEMDAIKVNVIDMATKFGLVLIPIVKDALKVFSDIFQFLDEHKPILYAVAAAIGTVLAAAVAAYAYSVGVKLFNSVKDMVTGMGKLVGIGRDQVASNEEQASSTDALAASTDTLTGSTDTLTAAIETLSARLEPLVAQLPEIGAMAAEAGAGMDELAASADIAGASMDTEAAGAAAADAASLPIIATIGLIVGAVAALGFGIYELVTHWKTVWDAIKEGAKDVLNFFIKWWPELLAPFTGGISLIVGLIVDHWKTIVNFTKQVWGDILNFFKQWWPEILGLFTGGIGLIIGLIIQHWSQISAFTEKLWHDVTGFFTHMWNDVTGLVSRGINTVVNYFEALPGRVVTGIERIGSDIENVFIGIPMWIYNNIIQPIIQFFENLPGQIGKAIGGLGSTIMNGITSAIPGGGIVKSLFHSVAGIFDQGGMIPGQGPQLAIVHGGEYVLTNDEVGQIQQTGATGKNLSVGRALNAFSPTAAPEPAAGLMPANMSPAQVAAAMTAQANQRPVEINQTFYTPMSPSAVANEVGWTFRTAALSRAGV